jgi:Rnk N-terminus
VLLGVALDVLHPYASEYLSADDYRRLIALVEAPVKGATEGGLAVLAEELARALAEADAGVIERLEGLRPPPTRVR